MAGEGGEYGEAGGGLAWFVILRYLCERMAYVNIILLTLGILGIVYGTMRLFVAKRYVVAIILTLFVSWIVFSVLGTQLCGNLLFVGVDSSFIVDHSFRSTGMCLARHDYSRMIEIDVAGIAYAALLIYLSRKGVHAKA